MKDMISAGLDRLGLTECVPPHAAATLADYGTLLLEKNQVMNLTAIRDEAGVAQLHMLDCAALIGLVDFEGKTLIDVGTGAGFPGLVLKSLVPSLQVTLLDSLGKRVNWLNEVSEQLGLDGVTAIHARAEEQALVKGFRDGFDFATARADCDQELAGAAHCIKLLGGRVEDCKDYTIPGTEVTHRLVVIRKVAPTLKGYPRKWAKIQKEPL